MDSNIYLIRNGVIQVEYEGANHATSGDYLVIYENGSSSGVGGTTPIQYQAYFTFKDSVAPTKMGCDAWAWTANTTGSVNVLGRAMYLSSKGAAYSPTSALVFHWGGTAGEITKSSDATLKTPSSSSSTTYTYNNKMWVTFNFIVPDGNGRTYGSLKIKNLWVTRG